MERVLQFGIWSLAGVALLMLGDPTLFNTLVLDGDTSAVPHVVSRG